MKIRNGFVSNSSSSSFVLLGTEITDELKKRMEEKYGEDWSYEEPDGLVTINGDLVGFVIAMIYDDGQLDDKSFSLGEINEKAKDISEKLGISVSEVKLYCGTGS